MSVSFLARTWAHIGKFHRLRITRNRLLVRRAVADASAIASYRALVGWCLPILQEAGRTGHVRLDGHSQADLRDWLCRAQDAGLTPDADGDFSGPPDMIAIVVEGLYCDLDDPSLVRSPEVGHG